MPPVKKRVAFGIIMDGGQKSMVSHYAFSGKAKAYNTCRAPQAATATSEALVMSQAKLA